VPGARVAVGSLAATIRRGQVTVAVRRPGTRIMTIRAAGAATVRLLVTVTTRRVLVRTLRG
jgi:hypothetical protein